MRAWRAALLAPGSLLAVLTALRLAVAAAAPLSPDEAYYWVWSRALQPGYLDHPPMVALWIRFGTLLLGANPLGVRLLGPLAAALGTALLADAAECLMPQVRAGLIAGTLLNATLLFGVGAVTMTPDTPLLFFWTAALWALARMLRSGEGGWWLVAGLATGAALDSKYTGFLLLGGIGLWLLLLPRGRRWIVRREPWLGGALSLACFMPVLAWNAGHGWVSLLKQGGRNGMWHPANALRYLGELIGGQVGLATPVVFALCVGGVVVVTRRALRGEPASGLLACLVLPGAAVFFEHAIGDRVQGNWPAVLYPAAAIAAATVAVKWWKPGAALGFALTALVSLQAAAAPLALPPRIDVTLAKLGGWGSLARQVEAARLRTGAAYVAADEYGVAALLAWYLPDAVPVIGLDPHWRTLSLLPARPVLAGRTGLLVRSTRRGGPPDPSFWTAITPAGEAVRGRNGITAETFTLDMVTGAAQPPAAALLPHAR